ncbi:hypothetical protein ARMGADRAFT_1075172 [Armillaria gallica]|uniref:Uncharacterized protein n=1 Tax=Armillaria gallica TaxID=47427 RepID=A0A2H3E585_ARMGA|nr:hypothetical protein ARMGADRAFT_1075172 [Armillaria gallica]
MEDRPPTNCTSLRSSSYQRPPATYVYDFRRFTLTTNKNLKEKDAAEHIEDVAFFSTDCDCKHHAHQKSSVMEGFREEESFGHEQLLLIGNVGGALSHSVVPVSAPSSLPPSPVFGLPSPTL